MFGLSELTVKLILIGLVVAAIAGGVGYIYHRGVIAERDAENARTAKELAKRAAEIAGLDQDVSDGVKEREEVRAAAAVQVAAVRAERKGRLDEFVPNVADSDTCIRAGWVRYVDAAAAGVPLGARPRPGAAEAPAGVTTNEAAAVVTDNYDLYFDCKKRVEDIFADFDDKRGKTNTVIDRINGRLKRAEGRLQ